MRSAGIFRLTIVFAFVFLLQQAPAQSLTKVKEWKVKEVSGITVDRLGNFFVILKKGSIKKYDPDGKVLASLSKGAGDLIEPFYQPSIFIYHRSKQQYTIYGRNFENAREYSVEPALAIEPYLISPTHDNKLWLLDKADYSLKRINPTTQEVTHEFTLPSDLAASSPEFTYLREYQNFLFLLDKKSGIWILNTFGKLVEHITIPLPRNFNFFGEELYYLDGNQIRFYDLITREKRTLAVPEGTAYALVTDERILLAGKNKLTLYLYPAEKTN